MKKKLEKLVVIILLSGLLFTACKDTFVARYISLEPVYMSYEELRAAVKMVPQQDLVMPGKIYTVGNFLFINEYLKGVHLYNNANPASPQYMGFINIPGNIDIAVKNNILYADSYVDLVAIDISDPAKAKEVGRAKDAFVYSVPPYDRSTYGIGPVNVTKGVVVGWEPQKVRKEMTQTYQTFTIRFGANYYADDFLSVTTKLDALAASGVSESGTGGSLSRFGLTANSLVAIDDYSCYNFDLTAPDNPKLTSRSDTRVRAETMFLYGKYMFLGSRNGMLVFDLTDVNKPVYVSAFWHATGCDPVVIQNNRAYITIRGGNVCKSLINRLDVLDITNILNPVLLRSYNMDNLMDWALVMTCCSFATEPPA